MIGLWCSLAFAWNLRSSSRKRVWHEWHAPKNTSTSGLLKCPVFCGFLLSLVILMLIQRETSHTSLLVICSYIIGNHATYFSIFISSCSICDFASVNQKLKEPLVRSLWTLSPILTWNILSILLPRISPCLLFFSLTQVHWTYKSEHSPPWQCLPHW